MRPVGESRRKRYLVAVTLSVVAVVIVWACMIWQTLVPQTMRIKEGYGKLIDAAAFAIKHQKTVK